jgi:hypothetical protein
MLNEKRTNRSSAAAFALYNLHVVIKQMNFYRLLIFLSWADLGVSLFIHDVTYGLIHEDIEGRGGCACVLHAVRT